MVPAATLLAATNTPPTDPEIKRTLESLLAEDLVTSISETVLTISAEMATVVSAPLHIPIPAPTAPDTDRIGETAPSSDRDRSDLSTSKPLRSEEKYLEMALEASLAPATPKPAFPWPAGRRAPLSARLLFNEILAAAVTSPAI